MGDGSADRVAANFQKVRFTMRTFVRLLPSLAIVFGVMMLTPADANAYIGPGIGITAIGTLLALISAIFFAVAGFIWYPIKRLWAGLRNRTSGTGVAQKTPVS